MRIILSNSAKIDLVEIWLYGAENWGIQSADLYVEELDSFMKNLSNFPNKYRLQRSYIPPVRIGSCGSHLVVYNHDADTVSIIRVLHKTMDVPGKLDLASA